MERKNDSTILLLVAAGLGIYWFMKNKSLPPATTTTVPNVVPSTTLDQTIARNEPVYTAPVDQTIVSTQPVYTAPVDQTYVSTEPVYSTPVDQTYISTQPVYDQSVQSAVNADYTPVTDMFNTFTSGGGLSNNMQESAVNIDNINLTPKSALKDEYL